MNWLEAIEDEARKRGEEAARLDADPAYQARMAAKRREEHERGVRLGWWTEDGEPIPQPEEEDEPEIDEYDDGRDFTPPYEP